MAPTTNWKDVQRFAAAIQGAGGVVGDALGGLLTSFEVLNGPAPSGRPEDAIIDEALAGKLTQKRLAGLAPAAADAASVAAYLKWLSGHSENILLNQAGKVIKAGGADEILDSLRPKWDRHAKAIERARTLINPQSTAEMVIESGEPALVDAWKTLNDHLRVINQIASIAAQFGPRLGWFPQIIEYALGDNFRLNDRTIMCTGGELVSDSALFGRPDSGHRSSPWFKTTLKLHSVESARERYNAWAADEHDRIHSVGRGGRLIDGVVVPDPVPRNPYRQEASV
jgi:hypothetical protein